MGYRTMGAFLILLFFLAIVQRGELENLSSPASIPNDLAEGQLCCPSPVEC